MKTPLRLHFLKYLEKMVYPLGINPSRFLFLGSKNTIAPSFLYSRAYHGPNSHSETASDHGKFNSSLKFLFFDH